MAVSRDQANARRRLQRLIADPVFGPKYNKLSAADKRDIASLKGRAARQEILKRDESRRSRVAQRSRFRRIQTKGRKAPTAPLSPGQARTALFNKMHDLFSNNVKWSGPATSRRIDDMTDEQVYATLPLSADEIAAVGREPNPGDWQSESDHNQNVLWYHGGEL